MVTNLNVAKEKKDFIHIERKPIRNVMQVPDTNKFWLFDNEYGMYVGYKYLFTTSNLLEYTKWFWVQEQILKSICVFNENTVKNIQRLASMQSPHEYLLAYVREKDPLYHKLEAITELMPLEVSLFRERFHERLKFLMMWINFCAVL